MHRSILKDTVIIFALLFIALWLRSNNISNICFVGDEYMYWSKTVKILLNNFAPVVDVFKVAPPFLSYIGAIFALLTKEGDLNTLRWISVIFGSLTVPLMYLLGKTIYDRKTGVIAAIFLCFSPYHRLYSQLYMLESITIFFITMSLYFFWKNEQKNKKELLYSVLAGLTMGMAFDAKYLSFYLVPTIVAYILWVKDFKLKALFSKHIVLVWVFAFIAFLPLLACLFYLGLGLYPFYFYTIEMHESVAVSNVPVIKSTINDIITKGLDILSSRLVWRSEVLGVELSEYIRLLSIIAFFITLSVYLILALMGDKKSRFFVASLLIFYFVLLWLPRHPHYLLYSYIYLYMMESHLIVKFIDDIKLRKMETRLPNLLKLMITVLLVNTLIFTILIGTISPYSDRGEYSWIKSAVDYIKIDTIKHGYRNVIIGTSTLLEETLLYPLYIERTKSLFTYEYTNFTVIRMYKPADEHEKTREVIDLEKINKLKPIYLVIVKYHYDFYFNNYIKRNIFRNYTIMFYSPTTPHQCMILKRKDYTIHDSTRKNSMDSSNSNKECLKNLNNIAILDFKGNAPKIMESCKTYTILVELKNLCDSYENFGVYMHSNGLIFADEGWREISLNPGAKKILKFKIIAMKPDIHRSKLIVDLYIERNGTYIKIYSISDTIYFTKK